MGTFVLIGGGENGREGTEYETGEIDKEIVKLTKKKKNIHFLFLAHGNSYEESYYEVMRNIYANKLKCKCDILRKKEIKDTESVIEKIKWADIIYIGGGNTLKMMNAWRKYGIDQIMKSYLKDNKVFCGISAGAICWCNYGISDSKMKNEIDGFIRVKGIGIFNMLFCPSYDERINKEDSIDKINKRTSDPMIALEKGTAIVINDKKYKVIKSLEDKRVYKCFYKNKNKYKIEIPITGEYEPLKKIETYDDIN